MSAEVDALRDLLDVVVQQRNDALDASAEAAAALAATRRRLSAVEDAIRRLTPPAATPQPVSAMP